MSWNMDFLKFNRKSKEDGFSYNENENHKEIEYLLNSVSMTKLGFNLNISIQNYTAEAVLLGGNLSGEPVHIKSLLRDGIRPSSEVSDYVIVTILNTENNSSSDTKARMTLSHKTEIRIPGKMLNKGSVFINELNCYLMTESQVDATREWIVADTNDQQWNSISVPATFAKQDPETLYHEYKQLAKDCVKRQDKIKVRVGVDLAYGVIPDIVKTFRIAIADTYFVPYDCYRLVYDPTLSQDEFVIENLHQSANEVFVGSFAELAKTGNRYLTYNERDTIFGKFYDMAIFANGQRYVDYVHQRKSLERFHEEGVFLANRSGDPLLKEEIGRLEREVTGLTGQLTDATSANATLRERNTTLKNDVKERENTITKLRSNHDAKMSTEAVMLDLGNDTLRAENEQMKTKIERLELEQKERAAPALHKATLLKTVADMMKSTWGITTACVGGVLSVIALLKKYNVKISMAT